MNDSKETNKTYGFFGFGLIGGSLAKNLRSLDPSCRIFVYTRHPDRLQTAVDEGIADCILPSLTDERFRECDVIFLCAPVGSNIEAVRSLRDVISPDCLLTDVGSVKNGIHKAVREAGLSDRFIGGHPMTGSEKSGYENAKDHLFENAYYILTPEQAVPEEKVKSFRDLVGSLHALPLVISCEEHDYITAAVSHLPHVIASSLVNTVHNLDSEEEHMKMIAAGGFKDITRIASSSPEMWEHICISNHENITRVMDEFIRLLIQARDQMNEGNGSYISRMFEQSRDYRDSFQSASHGLIKSSHRIYCDIIDESGAIATIATILALGRINIKNIGILHNREFEEGVLQIEFYDEESAVRAVQILEHHRYEVWKV